MTGRGTDDRSADNRAVTELEQEREDAADQCFDEARFGHVQYEV